MFGMSMTEILMILVIVLVVLGPEKIPEVAKFVGKAIREVRKASNLLRDAVMIDDIKASVTRPTPIDTTSYNSVEGTMDYEDIAPSDPSPEQNIRLESMNARKRTPLVEVALQAVSEAADHREIYLHVPYEETI